MKARVVTTSEYGIRKICEKEYKKMEKQIFECATNNVFAQTIAICAVELEKTCGFKKNGCAVLLMVCYCIAIL